MSPTLLDDAKRLTTPRPFEPDYTAHLARLADDDAARARLHAAGYYCHPDYLRLIDALRDTLEGRR